MFSAITHNKVSEGKVNNKVNFFFFLLLFFKLLSTSLWGVYSYDIHPSITLFHSLIHIVDIVFLFSNII